MTESTEESTDRELQVKVHDEDDGEVFHIKGEADGTVAVVVDKLYGEHLHRERRSGDRLRCEGNGDDVFEHLEEHLRNYRKTHCHELVWKFVGDQGAQAVILPPSDPEVAALTFRRHLETFWANRDLDGQGWRRVEIDPLHTIVTIPARRADGVTDDYFLRLGAEYYDSYPPTVLLVTPEPGWPRARANTTWWPRISNPSWFGLHDTYQFVQDNGQPPYEGQLLCFSMTAEYYISSHNCTDEQRWRQGTHTVAATLSRLRELLSSPHYEGPSATRNP